MHFTSATVAALALYAQYVSCLPPTLWKDLHQIRNAGEDHPNAENGEALACPFNGEAEGAKTSCPMSKRQAPGVVPPFNATQQYVSNQGAHAFVAPSGNDQRGPCPGLNAMANHNYMPHSGVGSLSDFINGCQEAFGMGTDLATFLATYAAVFDGNLTSYSIGGPYPSLLNAGGLLGTPNGLSNSHNKYEGDGSPTRGDLYQYGNDYFLQLSQFINLYELGLQNGNSIDLPLLTKYRNTRFAQSINNNPYFFYGPFSGVVVQAAMWSFIYRFMANKSSEYPEGLLNGETLKSFYGITGNYPNFQYTPGHETFPDNWYKRNLADSYTIPYLSADTQEMALTYPEFVTVGGNRGTPNSFTGVDPSVLTSEVFNTQDLLQGNNILCFGFEVAAQEAPDFLSGIYEDTAPAVSQLNSAVSNAIRGLGCPQLSFVNTAELEQYPGYTGLSPIGRY